MKQNSKGGKRLGAGRKPSSSKKRPITLYIDDATAENLGGWDELKKKLYDFIASPSYQIIENKGGNLVVRKAKPEEIGKPVMIKLGKKQYGSQGTGEKVMIEDLTTPTNEIKPQEQPKTNFSTDTTKKKSGGSKGLKTLSHTTTFNEKGEIVQDLKIQQLPKTLDELKAMCPKELTGIDRGIWIAEERKKYNL